MTLGQARAKHRLDLEDLHGAKCPVCKRHDQIYGRALNSAMARFLIWLYRQPLDSGTRNGGWIRVLGNADYQDHAGEYSKVVMWKLAEHLGPERDEWDPLDTSQGEYRITQLGLDFVHRRVTAPRKLWFYHNDLLDVYDPDAREIWIDEALGTGFNYLEMMEGKA